MAPMMSKRLKVVDLTYALLAVLLVIIDGASSTGHHQYSSKHVQNNNTDSSTDWASASAPPAAGAAATVHKHCQPMPSEILWRRVNPKQSYEAYLSRIRDVKSDDDDDARSSHALSSSPMSNTDVINGGVAGDGHQHNPRKIRKAAGWVWKAKLSNDGDQTTQPPPPAHEGRLVSDPSLARSDSSSNRKKTGRKSSRWKRRERRKARHERTEVQSWHCRLEKVWKKMPDGIFPAYVQTGRCVSKTCMLGLFECRPKRYAINVLKRNEGVCNPVPLVTSGFNLSTYYEESWTMTHHKVTVACECSKKRQGGTFYKESTNANGQEDIA